MRSKIVAGNWKMNNDLSQTEELISGLKTQWNKEPEARVIIAPPYTNLYAAFKALRETPIEIAAQNMHQSAAGAFTGEISAEMLKSIGVKTVILGHSERRSLFGETDEVLSEKVNTALKNDMEVIFCVGEELEQRKSGAHFETVAKQLENGLFHISKDSWDKVVIAYEPVWAIGTGETASPDQAQEMHAFIRKAVSEEFDQKTGDAVSILYGGSVKPANAKEIFANEDVDGGLIGGASLKAEDFMAIVQSV